MFLKTLHLQCFRNYKDQRVVFDAPKTVLLGDNAQGKTNLLEAVEILSTLKSHRVSRDRDLVLNETAQGKISGELERSLGDVELAVKLRSQGRKTVSLNGETIKRHIDFLSTLNVVQFSSLDLELVRGGPEHRRTWVDRLLVQLEPIYAHILQQYNQVLRQRNALLKQAKTTLNQAKIQSELSLFAPNADLQPQLPPLNRSEIALWDAQLAATGSRVIRRRDRVVERLAPLAAAWHRSISGSTENLAITYQPNVQVTVNSETTETSSPENIQQAFLEKIASRAVAEQYQGTSLVGPHRDDVEFIINQTSARQYGSSGQQRTLVLALKLAELQLIEEVVGEPPLLLLDDVLAELDLGRQNQLLETIQDRFQTLITTTHLGAFDAQWLEQTQILSVRAGTIEAV